MYTDGSYLLQNPDWNAEDGPWKAGMIAAMLKRNNLLPLQVMELGCGSGIILKELSLAFPNIQSLTGYDISPQAIAIAKKWEEQGLHFMTGDFPEQGKSPVDLLLVIDVLEHLDDFYGFLRRIRLFGKKFIFHIPLDLSCRTLMKPHVLHQQRNTVGHIHYFSREMVEWALRDTGYEVIDWQYTQPRIDIDPPDGFKRALKKILRNFSFSISRDWSVKMWGGYSMLILAQ